MKHTMISLVVICMLISNAFAAGELKDSVVVDKTKETLKEIDKGISVRDTTADIAKYDVKTEKNKITISKTDTIKDKKVGHTKTKLVMDEKTARSIDIDEDGLFGYARFVDGQLVESGIVTLAELINGKEVTFSDVIINGFSGSYSVSKTVTIGNHTESFNAINATAIVVEVEGVGEYQAWDENNISTYVSVPSLAVPFNGNATDISPTHYTPSTTNMSYTSDFGIFGGKNSFVSYASSVPTTGNYTYIVRFNTTRTTEQCIVAKNYYPTSPIYATTYLSSSVMSAYLRKNYPTYSYSRVRTAPAVGKFVVFSCEKSNVLRTSVNGVLGTSTPINTSLDYSNTDVFRIGQRMSDLYFKGYMDYFILYPNTLTPAELMFHVVGFSGSSVQFNSTGSRYPLYSDSQTITPPASVNSINILSNTNESRNVTFTAYFTEDTTLISDTNTSLMQTVNISHSRPSVAESGQLLPYEILDGYDGTAVLTTNNTNASISQNETHFIISTGYISAGSTYYYLVEIPTIRITSYTPTNNNVSNLYGENTLYTVYVSEASDIVWKIDNSTYKTVSSVTSDSLSYGNTFNVGMHNITANIINSYGDLTDSNTWNVDVYTNSFQNMGNSLTDDINESYLLMGTLLISLMGITILIILYGAFTGKIDIPLALMAVLVIIISSALMVISIIMLNALIELI